MEPLSGVDAEACAEALRAIAEGGPHGDPAVAALVARWVADDRTVSRPPPTEEWQTPIAILALDALAALEAVEAIERVARTPRVIEVPSPAFDQGVYIGCYGTTPCDVQAHAKGLLERQKARGWLERSWSRLR